MRLTRNLTNAQGNTAQLRGNESYRKNEDSEGNSYTLTQGQVVGSDGDQYVKRWLVGKLLYGAPFVKILYLTDLAQKLLYLRAFSYLCAHLAASAQR